MFSSYTEQILSRHSLARIHSVFPNGFNLNFNGELVYVSYYQKDQLSARGLAIDRKVYAIIHPYLKVGLQVRFRENKVVFYTRPNIFTIKFIECYSKNLQLMPVSKQEMEQVHLKETLEQMDLLKTSGFTDNQVLLNTLKEIQQSKTINVEHIKHLIGAGVGLTPSGDDFLQGFMLMEQLIGKNSEIQKKVQNQLKERSTTDISLSYYEALFDGYYNEDWIRLFEMITKNDKKNTQKYLSLIKKYGKTSGYDILLGILTYLQNL